MRTGYLGHQIRYPKIWRGLYARAEEIDAVEGYMVYGVYDVIAKVKAHTMDKLKGIVTWHVKRLYKVGSSIAMMVTEETK